MERITKKQIDARLEYFNNFMGTKFKVSVSPNGYDMYEEMEFGGHRRNYIGFDYRKSARETFEYINGLIACAEAIHYGFLK